MNRDNNPDDQTLQALRSLDQVCETIDVISNLVHRLKRHLQFQRNLANSPVNAKGQQPMELDLVLLQNERELEELQTLAEQQRLALMALEIGRTTEHPESEEATEHCLVIEICHADDNSEEEMERVLH